MPEATTLVVQHRKLNVMRGDKEEEAYEYTVVLVYPDGSTSKDYFCRVTTQRREEFLHGLEDHFRFIQRDPRTLQSPPFGEIPASTGPLGPFPGIDPRSLGVGLCADFVPRDAALALKQIQGSLVVHSTDPAIPWEIACQDNEFLSTRYDLTRSVRSNRAAEQFLVHDWSELKVLLICPIPKEKGRPQSEGAKLRAIYDGKGIRCEPLFGELATRANIMDRLGRDEFHIVHYNGHVISGLEDPLESELAIQGGDRLTLHDFLDHLKGSGHPFVFINGCRSTGASFPETFAKADAQTTNWAQYAINNGASGFLGTLWPVDRDQAATLATKFHEHLRRGNAASKALRLARKDVQKSDQAGYTWPAYVYYGSPSLRLLPGEPKRNLLLPWQIATAVLALMLVMFVYVMVKIPIPLGLPGPTPTGPSKPNVVPPLTPVSPPTLIGVVPQRVAAREVVTLTLLGNDLSDQHHAYLERPGEHRIPGDIRAATAHRLDVVFDLHSKQTGPWSVTLFSGSNLSCILADIVDVVPLHTLGSVSITSRAGDAIEFAVFGDDLDELRDLALRSDTGRIPLQISRVVPPSNRVVRASCPASQLSRGGWDVLANWNDDASYTLRVELDPSVLPPAPTVTPTSAPTPTSTPTTTATPTAQLGAFPSLTQTTAPSPVPPVRTPPPTPDLRPILREPPDGATLSGWSLTLLWQIGTPLGPDEYFDVLVGPVGSTPTSKGWSNSDGYAIGQRDLSSGTYVWCIRRIRFVGTDAQGKKSIRELSPLSELRTLTWGSPGGGSVVREDKDQDGSYTPDDCNDNDPSIHPGALERPHDLIDSNCDGRDDP